MNNITEFDQFRESIPHDNHGDLHLTFLAKVKYVNNGKTEHETLNVTLKYDTLVPRPKSFDLFSGNLIFYAASAIS